MDVAHLCYMANQIARNFAVLGEAAAIVAGDRSGLEPIAQVAVERLER